MYCRRGFYFSKHFQTEQKQKCKQELSKKWIELRGFGFISPDDGGPDIFTHKSYTNGRVLIAGDKVTYQTATDLKTQKPIATEIRILNNGH